MPRLPAVEPRAPVFDPAALEPLSRDAAPAFRQLRQGDHAGEPLAVAFVVVEQGRQPRERPVGAGALDAFERVALLRESFLQNAVIPAGATGTLDPQRHVAHIKAQVQLEAGLPSLAHLQQRRSEADDVADADGFLGPACRGEIFAEGAGRVERGAPPISARQAG